MHALLLTLSLLACDGGDPDDTASTNDTGSADTASSDTSPPATGQLTAAQDALYGSWVGTATSSGCAGGEEGEINLEIGALGDGLVIQDNQLGYLMDCPLDPSGSPAWICPEQSETSSAGEIAFSIAYTWTGALPADDTLDVTYDVTITCSGIGCAESFPESPCSETITATLTPAP